METTLRDEIDSFLENAFTEEAAGEFKASLMLFDAFEYAKPFDDFSDILYDIEAEDKDITREKMISAFNRHLTAIFTAHQIALVDDVEIYVKNQILGVLYRLQHLEDPVPVLRILESSVSDEEKLAKIIDEFCLLDETEALSAFDAVSEETLKSLMKHLYAQEELLTKAVEEDPKDQETKALLVKNLKDFFIVHGTDCLAHQMLDNGVQPGWSSRLYYPFTKDLLVVPDDNQTAKNLLSFFFFAVDTFNDPLKVYHVVSDHLLTGTERITRIEVKIADMINAVRQYQKAQNDARQVSVVQHQV